MIATEIFTQFKEGVVYVLGRIIRGQHGLEVKASDPHSATRKIIVFCPTT